MDALRIDTRGLICGRTGSLDIRLDILLMANDIMSNLFKETSVCEKSKKLKACQCLSPHPATGDVRKLGTYARTL